jgi:hypothetical protein
MGSIVDIRPAPPQTQGRRAVSRQGAEAFDQSRGQRPDELPPPDFHTIDDRTVAKSLTLRVLTRKLASQFYMIRQDDDAVLKRVMLVDRLRLHPVLGWKAAPIHRCAVCCRLVGPHLDARKATGIIEGVHP